MIEWMHEEVNEGIIGIDGTTREGGRVSGGVDEGSWILEWAGQVSTHQGCGCPCLVCHIADQNMRRWLLFARGKWRSRVQGEVRLPPSPSLPHVLPAGTQTWCSLNLRILINARQGRLPQGVDVPDMFFYELLRRLECLWIATLLLVWVYVWWGHWFIC